MFQIEASCCCHTGRVRRNNEDNLYFNGRILELEHGNLSVPITELRELRGEPICYSVFDGMGGEECGEVASYLAAETMKNEYSRYKESLLSGRKLLERIYDKMNAQVCKKAAEADIRTGSTAVSLLFETDEVYAANLGDSRAYRLREHVLQCLSEDHIEHIPEWDKRKPGLTQYLGVPTDELTLVPSISKGALCAGDQYLLCSDGLTDMVSNAEICAIMLENPDSRSAVTALVQKALEHGGRDNITVILIRVTE